MEFIAWFFYHLSNVFELFVSIHLKFKIAYARWNSNIANSSLVSIRLYYTFDCSYGSGVRRTFRSPPFGSWTIFNFIESKKPSNLGRATKFPMKKRRVNLRDLNISGAKTGNVGSTMPEKLLAKLDAIANCLTSGLVSQI